ncbi:DUF5958 family protein [Streptomyces heilongjiangensis]|uniref:DUF5958 family protein n=1 Tax=Streptomyces heilongjiangensis TaxID=945052 RepID=A0ABW1BJX7_9ACTN|nr:DUF5958 family protein [Streptomyces heilongjiangensis]MDC2951934.1 DUF5958 family protein [Streptomyces heilongjiangensis]
MTERDIILNELAQGLRPMSQGIEWFDTHSPEEQAEILLFLRHHCVQEGTPPGRSPANSHSTASRSAAPSATPSGKDSAGSGGTRIGSTGGEGGGSTSAGDSDASTDSSGAATGGSGGAGDAAGGGQGGGGAASGGKTSTPKPSPKAVSFAAVIQYTDDQGGGCTSTGPECESTYVYGDPGPGGADTRSSSPLAENTPITVTCKITDGRRLGSDVGPKYGGPKPPPYTTWFRLDSGMWATAVYAKLLHDVPISQLPKCS